MRLILFLLTAVSCFGQVGTLKSYLADLSTSNVGWMLSTFYTATAGTSGGFRLFKSKDSVQYYAVGDVPTYNCGLDVRDPGIIAYGGNILMSHTAGACAADTHYIGLTKSSISAPQTFDNGVFYACPLSGYCWAPEWFADPRNCTYATGTGWTCSSLSDLHLYFANSTNTTCCSAFTLYEMHPTASDFISNTASWSTPVALTFASGTPIPIDPFVMCKNSVTGADCQNPAVANDQIYVWYNDKASATGCINYGTIPGATGAITPVMTGNCYGFPNYVEGPTVFHLVTGSPGTWVVCFDYYQNTYNLGQLTCSSSTNNWSTWSDHFGIATPIQAKQGTIIAYP